MLKRVINWTWFIIAIVLLVPSFSLVSYADINDDLSLDGLSYRAIGDTSYFNPDSGLNNSTATSRSTTSYNFSGNGTFGGSNNTYNDLNVTSQGALTIQSGAVLENVTLNTTLGNTQEMESLIHKVDNADNLLAGILYALVAPVSSSSDNYSVQTMYGSITIPLIPITTRYLNSTNGVLTNTVSSTHGTIGTAFVLYSECLIYNFETLLYHLNYHFNKVLGAIIDEQQYEYWTLTPDQNNEYFSKTVVTNLGSWHSVLINRVEYLTDVITFFFSRFYEWFFPLDNTVPMYWRFYNTDTKQSEEIGLAGLMYNISWYLGNLYALQSENAALDQLNDSVDSVAQTFQTVEAQEHAVVDSVKSHIEAFNPNVSDFGAFRAIPWMSSYLQSIYVSLGTYGTVITIGLFLGVCLQLIGFLRYR